MQWQPEPFVLPNPIVFDWPQLLVAIVTLGIVLRVPVTIGFAFVQKFFDMMIGHRSRGGVAVPVVRRGSTLGGGGLGGGAGGSSGVGRGGGGRTLGARVK
ncbi:MAG: hypothetical protein AAF937_09450 [Planctomycetota bacterium]